MPTVKVYSTPVCPYCQMAKDFLTENNIKFEEVDVSKNRDAAVEMVEKSGQMSVPVIIIDEEVIVGFDREKLRKALKIEADAQNP